MRKFLFLTFLLTLVACGGGASSDSKDRSALTPTQISALTSAQIKNFSDAQISSFGTNIKYLSDSALNALSESTSGAHYVGQIQSITAAQIDALSPSQVRMIGAGGPGGSVTSARIRFLNSGAWAALVSSPAQVAAMTPDEVASLDDEKISPFGTNIKYLSNAALNALSESTFKYHIVGQIQSITAAQIGALSPAQVRMIGAAGPGGSVTTSRIKFLNSGAWAALVSSPTQVAAMTPDEIASLADEKISPFGANIRYLSDAALKALSASTFSSHFVGQIQSLTVTQIGALSPAQISVIASIDTNAGPHTGIAFLNVGAFSALSGNQVAVLTPTNIAPVSARQLASLTTSAIAGFTAATTASFTASQKAALTNAQRSACNC